MMSSDPQYCVCVCPGHWLSLFLIIFPYHSFMTGRIGDCITPHITGCSGAKPSCRCTIGRCNGVSLPRASFSTSFAQDWSTLGGDYSVVYILCAIALLGAGWCAEIVALPSLEADTWRVHFHSCCRGCSLSVSLVYFQTLCSPSHGGPCYCPVVSTVASYICNHSLPVWQQLGLAIHVCC
jgi:hypothetical protein